MKKLIFALFLVGTILTGCSPYTLLNSTVYNNTDMNSIKTFRMATPTQDQLPPKMTMTDYYNISNAIRAQLLSRGYTEDPKSPLLVNFGLTIQTVIDTEPAMPPMYTPGCWNGWSPWCSYWITPRSAYLQNYYQNAEIITGIQQEGVLIIDIVDTSNHSYVWSASVESLLSPGNKQIRDNAAVQQIVAVAFKKYPVPVVIVPAAQ